MRDEKFYRCGKVLCKKKDEAYNVDGVGIVCDECYFDLCECRDNAEYERIKLWKAK